MAANVLDAPQEGKLLQIQPTIGIGTILHHLAQMVHQGQQDFMGHQVPMELMCTKGQQYSQDPICMGQQGFVGNQTIMDIHFSMGQQRSQDLISMDQQDHQAYMDHRTWIPWSTRLPRTAWLPWTTRLLWTTRDT